MIEPVFSMFYGIIIWFLFITDKCSLSYCEMTFVIFKEFYYAGALTSIEI